MRAILTYHSIDPSGSPISIDPGDFRRHVRWLATGAVPVMPLESIASGSDRDDAVAVTFDDGFASFADVAWPLLAEHGIPVTLFVVTDRVGGTNDWDHGGHGGIPRLPLADWDTIGRLVEEGVAIGSHTRTHPRLDRLEPARLEDELLGSARRIEREIGIRPTALAYPFGEPGDVAEARAREAYALAVTTEFRPLAGDDRLHRLPRLDAVYFRRPGSLERWGTPLQRGRLSIRRHARRVRRSWRDRTLRGPDAATAAGDVGGPAPATEPAPGRRTEPDPPTPPVSLELVIPVLNEAHVLEWSVGRVLAFLAERGAAWAWRVTIVDNSSTDGTDEIGRQLAERHPEVGFLRLERPGRGGALRKAWGRSDADVVAYTDVDLSTDLEALPRLVEAIVDEGYDLATGSRLVRESHVVRSLSREIISRGYNLLLRSVLGTSFSDGQCGFKAVSRRVVREVMPDVEDDSWFFDSELLALAERRGYRIKDVPITWIEDDDSRVALVRTGWEDLKGIARLRRAFWKETLAGLGGGDAGR